MKFGIVGVLIIMAIMLSCKKEVELIPTTFLIDKQLRPYFNSFLNEAKIRNIKIDTSNLILQFNIGITTDKCGTCTQNTKKPTDQKTIDIYTNIGSCWAAAENYAREALIFHELGHCLLGRIEHKNDTFADGTPKSIMVASNSELYIPCVYVIDDDPTICNKTERRKYYIDELFNPNTPAPLWAK